MCVACDTVEVVSGRHRCLTTNEHIASSVVRAHLLAGWPPLSTLNQVAPSLILSCLACGHSGRHTRTQFDSHDAGESNQNNRVKHWNKSRSTFVTQVSRSPASPCVASSCTASTISIHRLGSRQDVKPTRRPFPSGIE